MLICWGMKDFVFDTHFLAEWERRFPEARVVRFADAGHYVLEDAAEEIVEEVSAFLQGSPQASLPRQRGELAPLPDLPPLTRETRHSDSP
jgi:hypothetical protein